MKAYELYTGQGKIELEVVRSENHRKMETNIIELFPCMERQTFHGFGGALTHASGFVLSRMDKDAATEVMRKYYAPDRGGYRFVRIPIDSSDFSPMTFNAGSSLDAISNDRYDFSYDEEFIFPWLDAIYESAGTDVPILLSPWSPPAFMKDNRSRLQGGRLLEAMKPYWARYLLRYVKEYRRRGYNVWGLTIQNEPNVIQTWDSCLYSADEERDFLIEYLNPEFDQGGLNDVNIFFWDHNRERLLSRSECFLQRGAENLVSGVALHGYCGDHFRAVEIYKQHHPQHRMIMSEFCMGYKDRFDYAKQLSVYGHEFIGSLASGVDTLFDWNLILDASGGPNHVGNFCMAPVMTDENYKPVYTMAFSVLYELAKSITPGCKVIENTAFATDLDCVAVRDENGVIHLLIGSTDVDQEINVRIGEQIFTFSMHKGTLTVLEVEEREYE